MKDIVRDFARAHRLRTHRMEDGSLCLPIGPKRRSARALDALGNHAWPCTEDGATWQIVVVTGQPNPLAARLAALGATRYALWDDGMLAMRCPQADLLRILDDGGELTRPHRKRSLSPERREAVRIRFAAMRQAAQEPRSGV